MAGGNPLAGRRETPSIRQVPLECANITPVRRFLHVDLTWLRFLFLFSLTRVCGPKMASGFLSVFFRKANEEGVPTHPLGPWPPSESKEVRRSAAPGRLLLVKANRLEP